MSKSITQTNPNNIEVTYSIEKFFARFRIASLMKSANAYKIKGFGVSQIFRFLFTLVFINRSMYMNEITGKQAIEFGKDTVYRFLKSSHIHWIRFTTRLSSRIICEAIFDVRSLS